MLAALSVGELWYRKGQEKEYLSIAFGFAEVLPDKVTILAQLAERAAEIDRERAEEARKRAETRLTEHHAGADYVMARASLMKALTRLQVSQRLPAGRVGKPRVPNVQ
jgi:F-type H+-transporting ATPase subunit epsilon